MSRKEAREKNVRELFEEWERELNLKSAAPTLVLGIVDEGAHRGAGVLLTHIRDMDRIRAVLTDNLIALNGGAQIHHEIREKK